MDLYIRRVNARARSYGITTKIKYATDGTHKFQVKAPDGTVRKFGRRGYWDFVLLQIAEENGYIQPGSADERRRLYLSRATKIKGAWRDDPFSPNNLAIHLLW